MKKYLYSLLILAAVCVSCGKSSREKALSCMVSFQVEVNSYVIPTGDIIVYNETKKTTMESYLDVKDMSESGKSCKLEGKIIAHLDEGDHLLFLHNAESLVDFYDGPMSYWFNYDNQKGTKEGALNGAIAKADVVLGEDHVYTSKEPLSFAPTQAAYKLKFTDTNNVDIVVKELFVTSLNNSLVEYYYPLSEYDYYAHFPAVKVVPETPTTEELFVEICVDEERVDETEELYFTVIDDKNNEYQGFTRASSLKNGNTVSIKSYLNKIEGLIRPTITRNDGGDNLQVEMADPVDHEYRINNSDKDVDITVTGKSVGYSLFVSSNKISTVRFQDIDVTVDNSFIYFDSDAQIEINGRNAISYKNGSSPIIVDGDLKLFGDGSLTLTLGYNDRYGFWSKNYNPDDKNNSQARVLAADGYTVTRSPYFFDDKTNTYTIVYDVSPVKL